MPKQNRADNDKSRFFVAEGYMLFDEVSGWLDNVLETDIPERISPEDII